MNEDMKNAWVEITGWKVKQVHYTLAYLAEIAVIKKDGKNWVLG